MTEMKQEEWLERGQNSQSKSADLNFVESKVQILEFFALNHPSLSRIHLKL